MAFQYTVRGIWPFPLDMLRYDGSEPASLEDAAVISTLSGPCPLDASAFIPSDIRLSHPGQQSIASAPRWESFGWTIVDSDDPWWIASAALGAKQATATFEQE